MSKLFLLPDVPALDASGATEPNAKLYFFETGTTTPADVYSDAALTTLHAHPVVADGNGRFAPIYLDPAVTYKVRLTDSSGTQIGNAVDPYATNGNRVGSIAELQASSGEAGAALYLSVSGCHGWFEWNGGNLSSEVMGDSKQAVYIAPASDVTGANGAWVRQYRGNLRFDWFGTDSDSVEQALAFAVAFDKQIDVADDRTILIPGDAATMQVPFDRLNATTKDIAISLKIQSGHSPASGVALVNGDWSNFIIQSEDPTVTLSASFSNSVIFVAGDNAKMPTLDCLVDANGRASRGYSAANGSHGAITAGNGMRNVYGTALFAIGGSIIHAKDTIWTGAATNGNTGSAMTSWASIIYADGADMSGSNFYGGQAAHGGILNADGANADGAVRSGFRANDAGILSIDGARARNCGVNAVRVYSGSIASGTNFDGAGSSDIGMEVVGSYANFPLADCSGATNNGVRVFQGGVLNFAVGNGQKGSSSSGTDIAVDDGRTINASGTAGGINLPANIPTGKGLIFDDTKDDYSFAKGLSVGGFLNLGFGPELVISNGAVTATSSYHRIDTENNAATDDLTTINGGTDGDILVIRVAASARDVVVKDAGNLRLTGDFVMGSLNDRMMLIHRGGGWEEVSRSKNT